MLWRGDERRRRRTARLGVKLFSGVRAGALCLTFASAAVGCDLLIGVREGKLRPDEAGGAGGSGGAGGASVPPPDAPRILFSDLESGPPDALITLYGARLVEPEGAAPEVDVGGEPASVVLATGGQAGEGHAARDLDTIVLQLPEGTPPGAAEIRVTRAGVTSDSLVFQVRGGEVYFAGGEGSDDANDGSIDAPFATLDRLVSALGDGDIGYVRAGDYSAAGDCGGGDQCALNLAGVAAPGTAAKPVAILGYPGERPRIGLLGAPADQEFYRVAVRTAGADHLVLANLDLADVGIGVRFSSSTASLRVVGSGFTAFAVDGVYVETSAGALTVLGSTFQPTVKGVRGVQACPATAFTANIGHCEFVGVPVPVKMEPVRAVDVHIHDNLEREPFAGLDLEGCFGVPETGPAGARTWYWNNVVTGAGYAVILPTFDTSTAEIFAFNNTFDGLSACGLRREGPGAPLPTGESVRFVNDIVVTPGKPYFCFHDMGAQIDATASEIGVAGSHNLWSKGTGEIPAALGAIEDPAFTGPDFHLDEASSAVDAGTTDLGPGQSTLPAFVKLDHGALPRVLGPAIDIGALERRPD